MSSSRFAWRASCVATGLSDSLREFSRTEQIPLSAVLLCAFHVLLLRYTSQEDIVMGCSVPGLDAPVTNGSGRVHHGFVLRADLSGDPTFRTLLNKLNAGVVEALSHEDGSLRPSAERLTSKPVATEADIQVAFSYRTSILPSDGEPNPAPTPFAHAPVDLHLDVQERGEDLYLHLRYNAEMFEAPSIERTLRNLGTLLQSIAADPDQPVSKLLILTEGEKRQILVEWNQTDCEYPRESCLHDLVAAQAGHATRSIAVVCGKHHLSYGEFNTRANQLAHYLRSRGVGPNVRVGICLEPALDFAVAMLAVLKAGGACVPLDPNYPPERLAYMLGDVQAPVVLTAKGMLPGAVPGLLRSTFPGRSVGGSFASAECQSKHLGYTGRRCVCNLHLRFHGKTAWRVAHTCRAGELQHQYRAYVRPGAG